VAFPHDKGPAGLEEHKERLKDLLVSIDSCYKTVQLKKDEWSGNPERRDILKQLVEQTIEFNYFVRDYGKTIKFGKYLSI
jgi:hypothetical protein